jgi:transmembrane sensor
MSTRYSPREIDRAAAEWAARHCAGLTQEDRQAFQAWLDADTRHLGAYAKAEAVLAQLARVGAAGAEALRVPVVAVDETPDAANEAARGAAIRRRAILTGTAAAGLAVAAGGAAWLARLLGQEAYSTSIGETREVVLSDNSIITLNTNSRVLVNYSKTSRRIDLVQGEALFDVAKNRKRPFIVTAADTQVRAVGPFATTACACAGARGTCGDQAARGPTGAACAACRQYHGGCPAGGTHRHRHRGAYRGFADPGLA